ncbi:MAG: hypothetical protein AAFW83_10385 [Pseudomonadota bacterium]
MDEMSRVSVKNAVGDFFSGIFTLGGGLLTNAAAAAGQRLNEEILGRGRVGAAPDASQNLDATLLQGRQGAEQGAPLQRGVTLSTNQILIGGSLAAGLVLTVIIASR